MKNVIITGGTRGIGAATAQLLADKGNQILITGRNSNTREFISKDNKSIQFIKYDAGNMQDLKELRSWIKHNWHGQVNGIVNNAGMFSNATLENIQSKSFEQILMVNVIAPTMISQALLPYLKKYRGCIINISSIAAQKAWVGSSVYSASKAAINQLTKVWATELAPDIRVNAIAPGPTKTDILTYAGLSSSEANVLRDDEKKSTPLKRIAEPMEIAKGIQFLLSEQSSHITGQILPIDGGLGI